MHVQGLLEWIQYNFEAGTEPGLANQYVLTRMHNLHQNCSYLFHFAQEYTLRLKSQAAQIILNLASFRVLSEQSFQIDQEAIVSRGNFLVKPLLAMLVSTEPVLYFRE